MVVKTGLVRANGRDLMHVFSTGCEYFEADRNYSKFAAYAEIAHSGNLHAAAAELRNLGYGKQGGNSTRASVDGLIVQSTPLSQIKSRP